MFFLFSVLIIILLFSIAFDFFTRKYVSPYHLIMKIGKAGSGKSTDIAREAIKYLKKGWIVYSNLDVNIPGVRIFNSQEFGFKPDEHSVIFIDEAGIYFSNRDFKNFSKQALTFCKKFRHYKCSIILYSQSFDVDKKLRDMCDEMYLIKKVARVFTMQRKIKKVLTIKQAQYSQDSDSQVVDNLEFEKLFKKDSLKFFYMPKYFQYFDSFERNDRLLPLRYHTVLPQSDGVDKGDALMMGLESDI